MTVDAYTLLRLVHILSAAILFGTGLGIAFFMWTAHRSRDVAAIAVTMRNVVVADFTGLCWLPVVWLQLGLRDLARTAAQARGELPPAYFSHMRLWFRLGWPAFISVLAIYALMVLRPGG